MAARRALTVWAAALLALLALLAGLPLPATSAETEAGDVAAAMVEAIAAEQDPRVAAALARIEGTDRRLLALRNYLRAGSGLAERWSWSAAQISQFAQSPEYRGIQTEIEKVRRAFIAANPGYQLWVNPDVRSLDTQLSTWNRNDSVGRAAGGTHTAFIKWRGSAAVRAMPPLERQRAATKFLREFVPSPTPTLAAPGLSPHGQMRAIDFHIKQGDRTVAGPRSASIAADWDGAGWAKKLAAAVRAGSRHFTGPLANPREPWHYTYTPAATSPQ